VLSRNIFINLMNGVDRLAALIYLVSDIDMQPAGCIEGKVAECYITPIV
jgi:hypothetical protein